MSGAGGGVGGRRGDLVGAQGVLSAPVTQVSVRRVKSAVRVRDGCFLRLFFGN